MQSASCPLQKAAWGKGCCNPSPRLLSWNHREVRTMELQIEHRPGPVRVMVQGPEDSPELQQIVALLQSSTDRL